MSHFPICVSDQKWQRLCVLSPVGVLCLSLDSLLLAPFEDVFVFLHLSCQTMAPCQMYSLQIFFPFLTGHLILLIVSFAGQRLSQWMQFNLSEFCYGCILQTCPPRRGKYLTFQYIQYLEKKTLFRFAWEDTEHSVYYLMASLYYFALGLMLKLALRG